MSTTVELNKMQADRATLLHHLLEVCDSHIVCASCGSICCDECHRHLPSLVEDRHSCDYGDDNLCETCWDECGPCRDEAARETAAEQRADADHDFERGKA